MYTLPRTDLIITVVGFVVPRTWSWYLFAGRDTLMFAVAPTSWPTSSFATDATDHTHSPIDTSPVERTLLTLQLSSNCVQTPYEAGLAAPESCFATASETAEHGLLNEPSRSSCT
jgi:hypothetical protein